MSDQIKLLKNKLARETLAREEAEQLLEKKTDELYDTLLNVSENQTLLKSALAGMQEGFLLTDQDSYILLFNNQLKNIYAQWAPSIHDGMNIKDFLFPVTEHPAYQNMISDGQNKCTFEIKLETGEVIAVTVNRNKENMIASTHRNITKDKAILAEQQKTILKLLQAQKMESIGKMASTVAHDFNNVIAAIKGYTSFLIEDIPQDDKGLIDSVEKIQQAANRAEDMVKQILNYSNHDKPTFELTHVGRMIRESIDLIEPNLPKHIGLAYTAKDEPIFTLGNTSQLTQVIVNIINNAINAIGKNQGEIKVSYEIVAQIDLNQPNYKIQQFLPKDAHHVIAGLHVFTDQCIKVNIHDNGPGMTPNIMDQLFDLFFTTRNSNTGTGLGMYGAAKIITDHIGGIKVYSKQNYGTYIEIILPLKEKHTENKSLDTSIHQSEIKEKFQVLIIDDNQEVGLFLNKNLSRAGFISKYVDNPELGLQEILMYPKRWKVIICDQKMPNLKGLNILKTIRAQGIDTPFILASGYIDEYAEALDTKLANHMIAKPIDVVNLNRILRGYFEKSTN